MVKPKVYADFHNADAQGRVRLNCVGTIRDLARNKIYLRNGLCLTLYADDVNDKGQPAELLVEGVVTYSQDEDCWVAVIDWDAIHYASEELGPEVSEASPEIHASTEVNALTERSS